MVTPEGMRPPREEKKDNNRGSLVLAGLAAGLLGILTFTALTSPESDGTDESTTTTTAFVAEQDIPRPIDVENFSIDQVAMGQPLEFVRGDTFIQLVQPEIVEVDGQVFLYAHEVVEDGTSTTAAGWRLTDVGWVDVPVPENLEPHTVNTRPDGLIAIGAGLNGNPAEVLTTTDGSTWTAATLPTRTGPTTVVHGAAAGSAGSLSAVAVRTDVDVFELVAAHFEAKTGHQLGVLQRSGIGWEPGPDDIRFSIHGPLGLELYSVTASELGLDDETRQALRQGQQGPGLQVFTSLDGSDWWESDFEQGWISSIEPNPGGGLAVFGHRNVGGRVSWVTYEGSAWESQSSPFTPYDAEAFPGGLLGLYDGVYSQLVVSTDGSTWRTVVEDLPSTGINWHTAQFAGGKGGVAAEIDGWQGEFVGSIEPATVLTEGGALTLDPREAVLTIDYGDVTHTLTLWQSPINSQVEVDPGAGTVTFPHPEDDTQGVTFTVEDLYQLESDAYSSETITPIRHRAFVFSRNSFDWTIQDMAEVTGDGEVIDLLVTEDTVYVLVGHFDQFTPFLQQGQASVEIWTASIP